MYLTQVCRRSNSFFFSGKVKFSCALASFVVYFVWYMCQCGVVFVGVYISWHVHVQLVRICFPFQEESWLNGEFEKIYNG